MIVFRTDASVLIGSGHIMRCLALADRLRECGAMVHFICREFQGHLGMILADKGYLVHWLSAPVMDTSVVSAHTTHSTWLGVPWQIDADQTQAVLATIAKVDWLIIDHYAIDRAWESLMRTLVCRIMAIDDLADRPHDCDLLLDQNLYEDMEQRYSDLVPASCRQLLGPHYALLRPEFHEARRNLRQRDGTVRRILVFFGGTDPSNETAKVLRAIQLMDKPDILVDVVVGLTNPHQHEIEKLCTSLPNTNLYCQISNMAELITRADLAISASGSSSWERCCLGLPTICIALADNQIEIAKSVSSHCAGLFIGNKDNISSEALTQLLCTVLDHREWLSIMSQKAISLVDGRGVGRIAEFLLDTV